MFVEGKINGVPCTILVDTGAAVTIVHRRIWDRGKRTATLEDNTSSVVTANGEPLKLLGKTKVTFSLADRELTHNILVTESITQDCLLGSDFLIAHGCVVDLKARKLVMGPLSTPIFHLQVTDQSQAICRVLMSETMVFRAGEERVCVGNVDIPPFVTIGSAGVVEPKEGFEERSNLLLARTLVVPDNGCLPVRLANLTESPVTVYKGTNVAIFSPLPSDSETLVTPPTSFSHVNHLSASRMSSTDLKINTSMMSQPQRVAIDELISEFGDVFSTNKHNIGRTRQIYHKINTGDSAPIRLGPRRVPIHFRQEISGLLDDMQRQDIIEPSISPWASPIVLVRKKDGSPRFCVDYRKLNAATIKDSYPLPRVDDILDSLSGSQWFSTLDLRSGYWQVEVDPADKEKTAFTTPYGLYQFKVMPFGLCNAPSTFQRLMELVLAGLHWETCLIYLDDVVVFGRTWEEHMFRIREVLSRLLQANLKLNPEKCQFFKKSVTFLGHIISDQGVSTDPEKIQAIAQWPTPASPEELRSFLGLASYYRRFIDKFAEIAAPLYRMQDKSSKFQWSEQCRSAFQSLKQKLSSAPVLAFPNPRDTFILDTDASDVGIGGVLSQVQDGMERVISYGSRTLSKSEKNYCVTRKELLALVYFMRQFRSYLLGHPFLVRTDHSSLRWLSQFKQPEGQLARWIEQLQEFDFQIEHRKGRDHSNADALSRIPSHVQGESRQSQIIASVCTPNADDTDGWTPSWSAQEIQLRQQQDPVISMILGWLQESNTRPSDGDVESMGHSVRSLWAQWDRLKLVNGLLYRQWEEANSGTIKLQLVLPHSFIPTVLEALHSGIGGGHFGVRKTIEKVRSRFYWPQLRQDVEQWCRQCSACAQTKSPTTQARGPLNPSKVGFPMERMALDIVGPLPRTKRGNKYILVVADYFTRWVEAYGLPNTEASTVAKVLVNEWICRFGAPYAIHSDQGRNFESQLFAELCTLLGIHKTRTTPYHPQSDGLVERFNRTLRMLLTTHLDKLPEDTWDEHLPMLMLAYRSSVQETTGSTPFNLMFGREVQLPVELMLGKGPEPGTTHLEYIEQLRRKLEEAYEHVRERTNSEQKRQKHLYDRKVAGGRYSVGDMVWLHSPAIPRGKAAKFHRFWKGPYEVKKIISDVTYRIQSTTGSRRQRLVVHFNRLKPAYEPRPQPRLHCRKSPQPVVRDDTDDQFTDLPTTPEQPAPPSGRAPPAPSSGQDPPSSSSDQLITVPSGQPTTVPRGGSTWEGRLRRTVNPPDYYRPGHV